MNHKIKVKRVLCRTFPVAKTVLQNVLRDNDVVSFDLETRSMFSKEDRAEYTKELEDTKYLDYKEINDLTLAANSSGLSHPSIVEVTHIIIGISREESVVIITNSYSEVRALFKIILDADVKVVIHNATFDLSIVKYYTGGNIFKDIEDTSLMAKVLLNDCNNYNSRTGLKHLMSKYYDPGWAVDIDYEVADLANNKFINYCAIDGASCYYLYELLEKERYESN
jgi:hypothetical protein